MSEPSEKKTSGAWAHLISELLAFIPKDLRELIGMMAGIYLFIFIPIIFFGGFKAVQKLLEKPEAPVVQCWQIQKVDGRLFKLNSCTGEAVEIAPEKTNQLQSSANAK